MSLSISKSLYGNSDLQKKKKKQIAKQKPAEKVHFKANFVSSKSGSSGWSAVSTVGLFLCFQASGGAQELHLPFFSLRLSRIPDYSASVLLLCHQKHL